MKVKNILMTTVAMAMVCGAASAEMTRERQKELCDKSPIRIWVEKTGSCVPKNACKAADRFKSYCNRTFKDIQVKDFSKVKELISLYMQKNTAVGGCSEFIDLNSGMGSNGTNAVGQDYFGCYTSVGEYIVFEFDDASESDSRVAWIGFEEGRCVAVGGTPKNEGKECFGLSKQVCLEIAPKRNYFDAEAKCSVFKN